MWPSIVINFLVIKPTRCTYFWSLFLEWNSTCFGQFLSPSSGVFHCTHSNGICHTGLLTYTIALCVQSKTPDDGQRNCPKHVEFHPKNKFEKWMHLVGFTLRNYSLLQRMAERNANGILGQFPRYVWWRPWRILQPLFTPLSHTRDLLPVQASYWF